LLLGFRFATASTVDASRSHRDSVGCGTPTSAARSVALVALGAVIRCTIRFRNASLYSTTTPSLSPPLDVSRRGGNYPDAGG
jgi:hypothetical protein